MCKQKHDYIKINNCVLFISSDCQALLDAGYKEDGIYTIHPFQNDEGIKVFCDMTHHTGWIVSAQVVFYLRD